MARRRLHQTTADYIVLAISPALIMTLVGSLVFFLLAVLYQGDFAARLHWVMACFVFAAVLIGRISIEEGFERAIQFGIALAIPVGIAAMKFVQLQGTWIDSFGWLIVWALIALIWWCAHRLTWDCTLIDDSQDASGEGLLQTVGLDAAPVEQPAAMKAAAHERRAEDADFALELEGTTSRRAAKKSWWQRYVERQRRPHAPGVWVVYFSLAALPLFGVGQWFIPATNVGGRRYAFWLLCVYVASGLGLLLSTSFLGLRRYLRQRRIEMPTLMANLWLGTGGAIIGLLLIAAALIPRPSAEYSISQLPFAVGSPDQKGSRMAPQTGEGAQGDTPGGATNPHLTEKQAEGDGEQSREAEDNGGPTDANDRAGDEEAEGASSTAGKSANGKSAGSGGKSGSSGNAAKSGQANKSQGGKPQGGRSQSKSSDAQANNATQGQTEQEQAQPAEAEQKGRGDTNKDTPSDNEESQQADSSRGAPPQDSRASPSPETPSEADQNTSQDAGSEQSTPPDGMQMPQVPPVVEALFGSLADIFKLAFYGVAALAVLYVLWRSRAAIWQALRDFWGSFFGRKHATPGAADGDAEPVFPPMPFASYADPFASGMASQYSAQELIRYSFEAFEAWAREHGCARGPQQTPHELARVVGKTHAFITGEASNLAELYARAAYAREQPPATTAAHLQRLWTIMRREMATAGPERAA